MARTIPPDIASDLDPGVREVVTFLYEIGFDTCDSGDGYSKLDRGHYKKDNPNWIQHPHVFIWTTREKLYKDLDRIMVELESRGVLFDRPADVNDCGEPVQEVPIIQATVVPREDLCIIEVHYVMDYMLT